MSEQSNGPWGDVVVGSEEHSVLMASDDIADLEARLAAETQRREETERDARSWRNACLDADGVVVDEVEFGYRVIKQLHALEAEVESLRAALKASLVPVNSINGTKHGMPDRFACPACRASVASREQALEHRAGCEVAAALDALTQPGAQA